MGNKYNLLLFVDEIYNQLQKFSFLMIDVGSRNLFGAPLRKLQRKRLDLLLEV